MNRMLSIFTVSLMVLSLTACGGKAPEETVHRTEPAPSLPAHVSEQSEHNGQALTIDADVIVPEAMPDSLVTLVYDPEAAKALQAELVKNPADLAHPDENGNIVGQIFDTEAEVVQEPGRIYYEDLRMWDREEKCLDEDFIYEEPYMTSKKPGNFQKSAEEVSREFADFLKNYSCLTYSPYSAEAIQGHDGAYSMDLLEEFEGSHILSRDFCGIHGQVRESGIEAFQGYLLLKEAGRQPLSQVLPLQEILTRFREDYHRNTFQEEVTITRIEACYMAFPVKDGWQLRPVWAFLGEISGEYIPPFEDYHSDRYSTGYIYDMEDGFLDVIPTS